MALFKKKEEGVQQVATKRGMVCFVLSGKSYAIDMESVREVIYERKMTPLPHAPDYCEGLIDLRGIVIPVIHLGKRLQVFSQTAGSEESRGEHILIVDINNQNVGFIVDRVEEVMSIDHEAIQPAQNIITSSLAVIDGVFRHKGRLILLVSLARLFTQEDMHQITEVLTSPTG